MSVDVIRSDDLGKLLAKIQDDLQYLKATAARAQDGDLDAKALDLAISRTERGVQAAAERVLASSQNKVVSLPTVSQRPSLKGGRPIDELVTVANKRSPLKEARAAAGKRRVNVPVPGGISPGQQVQMERVSTMISQPTHPLTRQMLTKHYGLPPPAEVQSTKVKGGSGQVITGTTIEPLTSLPRVNRRDAQQTPPTIGEGDAQRGLLNLLERGLIPPAAEIVLSPPPIQPRPVSLHPPGIAHVKAKVAEGGAATLAGVKLDPNPPPPIDRASIHLPGVDKTSLSTTITKDGGTCSLTTQTLALPVSTVNPRPQTPPATPTRSKEAMGYKVVIQNGSVVDGVKDFAHFKRAYRSKWPHIKIALNCVEELCRNYAVPLAILDGDKVSKMALECELGLRPSQQDILDCLINKDDIVKILNIPGRRYKGHRGVNAAAAKIQATYRMSIKRRQYLEYRRKKWAAGVVSLSWLLYVRAYKIRFRLKETRAQQLANHHQRAAILRRRWDSLKNERRTILHLPSLGYSQPIRTGLQDFRISQALQPARLCDVRDPNVEVIYISPVPVDQAVLDFYLQLLSMEGQKVKERVHVLTPENIDCFGHHCLSLTTHLLYSPKCLKRVQNLLKGKETYIVPGVVSRDDIGLADKLDLPLLGPDHEIAQLYSTKSGFKRIFRDANVATPPTEGDIFSVEQLVERLARLIVNHPLIRRWLFKLPEHIRAKGFAYCDVADHLSCHSWLVRESQRYGEKWSKKWAQEKALKLVTAELPTILSSHVHPLDHAHFPTWNDFLELFVSEGGLIEGTPPSESVTSLSVDLFVEPAGSVRIVSMRDQILSAPYSVWGSSLPQCSVPPGMLVGRALSVGSECKARGIIGYFTIDFVTFIHPKTGDQELWAVDLDLGYSDHASLAHLLSYVTGGRVDEGTGQLLVTPQGKEPEERFAVLSPHLMHTNLSPIYYPIFFQICKAHFIQYDPEEKEGTVFTLVDGQHREWLGMVCVQKSLLKALRSCSFNLSTIHQEISTTHMPGQSNFPVVSSELDSIAELMDYNQTHSDDHD